MSGWLIVYVVFILLMIARNTGKNKSNKDQ